MAKSGTNLSEIQDCYVKLCQEVSDRINTIFELNCYSCIETSIKEAFQLTLMLPNM